ncbi:hypothetical protein [Paenibacillus sp. tmac-D7]|uniref:hypothetical protein n=1 Tax=Paenibacillus sp. tmac-D7 TaxID=2591462 RepID=UPI001141438E|nr:hypothetical protein [Paenibacillus sp. tmac-D7]
MEQSEIMRISIENVRNIVNNSILLLKDADIVFSKAGFLPIHGNTIGSESSKDINQSPDQPRTFFPQYMTRYYSHQDNKSSSKLLGLNVQFYHFNYEVLSPCLIAAFCKLKNKESRPQYWWIKYCAFETDISFKSDGSVFKYEDEDAEVEFWGLELSQFNNIDDLQKVVISRLLAMY